MKPTIYGIKELEGSGLPVQEALHRSRDHERVLEEAIDAALHELGIPDDDYPAPVANAVELLSGALKATPEPDNNRRGGMMTIGTERFGLRVTRGRLSRRGIWHPNQPCIFWLINGRRRPSHD